MSNNENQPNQKPQEAAKEAPNEKSAEEKKAEGSGSKPEYKGNNPGGSGWKNKKKT